MGGGAGSNYQKVEAWAWISEVGAFYWTVLAPDIVNSEREEQGSISV